VLMPSRIIGMFKEKSNRSLRFRFLSVMSGILLFGTLVVSLAIAINEERMFRESFTSMGKSLASYIGILSKEPLIMQDRTQLDAIVYNANKDEYISYVMISDDQGISLTSLYASVNYRLPSIKAILLDLSKEYELLDIIEAIKRKERVMELSIPITIGPQMIANKTIGTVILGMNENKIHKQISNTILFVVIFNIVLAFALIGILFITSKRIIFDPIIELAHASSLLARGERSIELEIKTTGEVKTLVESFNEMVRNLDKVTVSKDYMDNIIRSMTNTLIVVSSDNRIISANAAACTLLGYGEEELIGRSAETIYSGESPDKNSWMKTMVAVGHVNNIEESYRTKNGLAVPVLLSASVIRDHNNLVLGVVYVAQDLSERKRAEAALRENEERLRAVFDSVQDFIFIKDEKRRYRLINNFFQKRFQVDPSVFLGRTDGEIPIFENKDMTEALIRETDDMVFRGEAVHYELTHLVCGKLITFDIMKTPIRDEGGRVTNVCGLSRDITERRQAEEALKESEERHRQISDLIADYAFSCVKGPKGEFVIDWLVGALERITGYSIDEVMDQGCWKFFVHPSDVPIFGKNVIGLKPGEKSNCELRITHKDGTIRWIRVLARAIEDAKELLSCRLFGSCEDITERKHAEEMLRETLLFQHETEKIARVGGWKTNPEKDLLLLTEGVNHILELPLDYKPGLEEGLKFYLPEYIPMLKEALMHALKDGTPFEIETEVITAKGKHLWSEVRGLGRIGEGEESFAVGTFHDITEHKRAENELRESERRLSQIVEFLPDAILVIDKDGKILAWNRAMEGMTGLKAEELIGKGNYEYSLPFYGDRRPILIDLALHPNREMEKHYTAIQRRGDIIFGEAFTPGLPPGNVHLSGTASVLRNSRGEVIAAIECIRDNTERRRLEERLSRAEKMEALGTLAGGVAHDLNNVLGVLVGYSELLLEKIPKGDPLGRYVSHILQSSKKAAAIIQDLLTLARRGVAVSEVVNLNDVVSGCFRTPEFVKLRDYHSSVTFRTDLEKDLLNIKGSSIHLEKTVMNLASNAAEAIASEGEVMIRTENRYLDKPIRGYEDMQEGDYAVLMVSDNGKGISATDIEKIFEPFYTKKVMGRSGTGLGLAVVWGTVKDHDGYIDVQSEEGKGSTFTIYFPITREELSADQKQISPDQYMGKDESILVVDDVEGQRELAVTMLTRLGYRVHAVSSGEAAVAYLKSNTVDLLFLDMIMDPGIDGLEAYRRVLEINPKQKAIIVSGFSETDRVKKAQSLGAGAYVKKPYVLEKLGLAIKRELERSAR
jgi:two-component system, cell cycle sensor histidine kinase and response regulator CckA